MKQKEKKQLTKIIIAILLLIITFFLKNNSSSQIIIYLLAYLIVGKDVVIKAIRNILKKEVFDENFLMSLATLGAIFIKDFKEAVLVMLLYQIGELFNSLAVGRSRKSIAALMDIRPDYANILVNGNLEQVAPSSIKVGETIIIQAGEKIPLDGIVIKGESILDTTALTGESLPRTVKIDDYVYSGCINKTGLLTVKVTKEYGESTVSKILNLVENASTKKAKTEKFITKFAKYYTPIVVILALSLACIPPIIIKDLTFVECLKRAMTFLVISCPCALVISVPLGFFGGIGGASKQGILIKGSNYLEALAKTKILVFDKTGTLTKGNFTVTKIVSNKLSEEKLLELAAYAESYSTHPIALSIVNSYKKEINKNKINDVKEISGNGIIAKVDNQTIIIGNKKLMIQQKIDFVPITSPNTITYIAVDDEYMGYLVISDEIKETTKSALKTLREKHNISKLVMLTGDNKDIAKSVSKELNLDEYYAELLPTDKVKKIEKLLSEKKENTSLAFVGDGINDAPVLTRADIGVAMGSIGSDAAIEAADIVIMDDNLEKITTAIALSKKTLRIVKQNIWFAISIKIFFLILGSLGFTNMMAAVFADVGVSIIAILNSMRTLKFNQK